MPGTPQPRADAGAERSAAIECKMLRGSTVVRSTPSRALRDSSAREGRPLFRFGFPGVAGGSSTICLALKFNHRGFLAFSSARVVSPSHRARVKRGLDPNILLPPPPFQRVVAVSLLRHHHCIRTPLCSTTSAPSWSSTRQPGHHEKVVAVADYLDHWGPVLPLRHHEILRLVAGGRSARSPRIRVNKSTC